MNVFVTFPQLDLKKQIWRGKSWIGSSGKITSMRVKLLLGQIYF